MSWGTGHLTEAADYWEGFADRLESGFSEVHNLIRASGWEGQAYDKSEARSAADKDKATEVADWLRTAAKAARAGASNERAAQSCLRYAVEDAWDAGFNVDDDGTVKDVGSGGSAAERATRQAQAEALAGNIRQQAVQLVGLDTQIGSGITTALGDLTGFTFDEPTGISSDDTVVRDGTDERFDGQQRGHAQQVDHTTPLPEAPGQPFPEAPWDYQLDLTSSDVLTDEPLLPSAGSSVSIDDVWNELNRCFNCNFPIGGAPKEFPKVGQELPLEIKVAGVKQNFPVRVTQIENTSEEINIEFVTLPGHFDGPDSTVHFRFFRQDGELHLGIRGHITGGPGSLPGPLGAPWRGFYGRLIAPQTWQPYINNLTEHISKAQGHVPVSVGDLGAPPRRAGVPSPVGPHYEYPR
jgi:hypothetical protein